MRFCFEIEDGSAPSNLENKEFPAVFNKNE